MLPPPPASLAPVAVPVEQKDARLSLFDHRTALAKANKRLRAARGWYGDVRADFARPGAR